jgi:hypothetical protein
MKYIKLWETWQWLNRDEDPEEERDYRATGFKNWFARKRAGLN